MMRMSWRGLSFLSTLASSMRLTTSMPAETLPNTVCLRSSQGVGTVVMKNWLPLVLGPALAMLSVNGLEWFRLG